MPVPQPFVGWRPHKAMELKVAKTSLLGETSLPATPLWDLNPALLCEEPDECMYELQATSLFLIHTNDTTATNNDEAL